jgi:hypothetical protein
MIFFDEDVFISPVTGKRCKRIASQADLKRRGISFLNKIKSNKYIEILGSDGNRYGIDYESVSNPAL